MCTMHRGAVHGRLSTRGSKKWGAPNPHQEEMKEKEATEQNDDVNNCQCSVNKCRKLVHCGALRVKTNLLFLIPSNVTTAGSALLVYSQCPASAHFVIHRFELNWWTLKLEGKIHFSIIGETNGLCYAQVGYPQNTSSEILRKINSFCQLV